MRWFVRIFGVVLVLLGLLAGSLVLSAPGQNVPALVVLSLGWTAGGLWVITRGVD